MKYPILMLGATKLFLSSSFYYLVVFPFAFVLNYFDTHGDHKTGTGLIVKAWKITAGFLILRLFEATS